MQDAANKLKWREQMVAETTVDEKRIKTRDTEEEDENLVYK